MSDDIELGWSARPLKEQFPKMDPKLADGLNESDRMISALTMQEYLTRPQANAARKKLFKKIIKAIEEIA